MRAGVALYIHMERLTAAPGRWFRGSRRYNRCRASARPHAHCLRPEHMSHTVTDYSITCLRCNYDLRGLRPSATCPECGLPVEQSTDQRLLRFADPRWGRRLSLGAFLLFLGIILSLFNFGYGFRTPVYELIWNLAWWVGPAALVLVGFWWVTTPDPGGLDAGLNPALRWSVRAAATAHFVMGGWQATWASQHMTDPLPALTDPARMFVLLVLVTSAAAYARWLASRLPNEQLARHARVLMIAIPAVLLAMLPLALIQFVMRGSTQVPIEPGFHAQAWGVDIQPPLAYPAIALMLALLVLLVWGPVLIYRFQQALRHEADLARGRAEAGAQLDDE